MTDVAWREMHWSEICLFVHIADLDTHLLGGKMDTAASHMSRGGGDWALLSSIKLGIKNGDTIHSKLFDCVLLNLPCCQKYHPPLKKSTVLSEIVLYKQKK